MSGLRLIQDHFLNAQFTVDLKCKIIIDKMHIQVAKWSSYNYSCPG